MMRFILVLIIFLFIGQNSFGQNNKTEMALYNIGLGGFVSGIGALINKKPNDKFGKTFFKAFTKGAFGGYLVYESKNLVGKIQEKEKLEYSWAAKVVNSTGISIIENASLNKEFLESWHMNIGFNRLEVQTRGDVKFKYRIMPFSLIEMARAAYGNKFELNKTIRSGEFIFSATNLTNGSRTTKGVNYTNSIVYDNGILNLYDVISHEIIHSYQYYDFNFVNTYFNKTFTKLENKSKFFRGLSSILYYDLNAPIFRGIYTLEDINNNAPFDNFFENEAGFWSNTLD